MKYNVYEILSGMYYGGISLVAAENAEKANEAIREFIKSDPENNNSSWGYEYIDESYRLDHLHSDIPGIIYEGIYYSG